MEKLKLVGECAYCKKEYAKRAITKHLNEHLKAASGRKVTNNSVFHLRIEPDRRYGTSLYFINLLMSGNNTFEHLDEFLRGIWLECCGHMSAFRNPHLAKERGNWDLMEAYDLLDAGKVKEYEAIMQDATGAIPKSSRLQDVLVPGLRLEYEYDFGSSTLLEMNVVGEFALSFTGEKILSRNEPLAIMCDVCKTQPAFYLCSACAGYREEGCFCKECAKKHSKACEDYKEYAKMKIVNSPRVGVCAYEGGLIDKKRDGIYKLI